MRTLCMVTTVLFTLGSFPAMAQNVIQDTNPQTLDGQLQQMQGGAQPRTAMPVRAMQAAPASGGMIQSQGNGAIPANALEVQTYGEISYITGGISDEETDMLKAHASEYNLHILINSTGGAFEVAEKFHVLDSKGVEVLRVDDAGPYVYAKLNPGSYTVEANQGGEIRTSKINVPAKGASKVQITFKQ